MRSQNIQRDNIMVCVRIRPLSAREIKESADICVNVDEVLQNSLILEAVPNRKVFNFDYIASRGSTQEEVFANIGKEMVETTLEGYNSTILAYGQTGAGKTYTMLGKGLGQENQSENRSRGLQPRVLDYIFDRLCEKKDKDPELEFLVKASYFEIYNESIFDLLNPDSGLLQVREDLKKGVFLDGVTEEAVTNSFEAIKILRTGDKNRHVGSTGMNKDSSRSHCILSLTIESKKVRDGVEHVTNSKFHFVDLAGSERQKMTQTDGQRLKEAGNINKSLTVLGSVINSLSEGTENHIRYRDSKLTFLLKDSLGGNSRTCMIANISPAATSFSETLSTLKFAQRAKLIKNKASINQFATGSTKNLEREITRLREELSEARSLINTLEDGQRSYLKHSPSQMDRMMVEEGGQLERSAICKELLESNKNQLEIEVLLRESLNVIAETEKHLQQEIGRKDEFLEMFNALCELHKENDFKLKDLIALYESKMDGIGFSEEEKQPFRVLLQENNLLRELAQNAPLIMQVFEENLVLKEKIRDFEVDDELESEFNVREKIEHNLIFLMEINQKIEESMEQRKQLDKKLGQFCYLVGLTPEDLELERNASSIKIDLNQKMEVLNVENLKLKNKCNQEESKNANLEDKLKVLQRKYEKITMEKDSLVDSYETRISELKEGFKDYNSKGKIKPNLGNELISTKDELESYKKKYEDLQNQMRYMENQFNISLKQKEDMLSFNQEALDSIREEKEVTKIRSQTTIGNTKALNEEISNLKQERETLSKRISEIMQESQSIKSNLEKALNDKFMLQNEVDQLKDRMTTENDYEVNMKEIIQKLETDISRETLERRKLEGELETLQDSYSFALKEIQKVKSKGTSSTKKTASKVSMSEKSPAKSGKMSTRRQNIASIVDDIDTMLEKEQAKVEALESQLEQYRRENKELVKTSKNVGAVNDKLTNEVQNLKKEMVELEANYHSKINEISELDVELRNQEKTLKQQKKEILSLQKQQKAFEGIEEKYKESEREIQEKIIRLQKNVSERLDEFHAINTKLKAEELKVYDLQTMIQQAQQEGESQKSEIAILKELNIEYEEKINELEFSINDMKIQRSKQQKENEVIKEQKKEIEGLRAQIIKQKEVIDNMGQKFEGYLNDQENELNLLKNKMGTMDKIQKEQESKLNLKKSEVGKLRQEIEYLKNEKINFQKSINEYNIRCFNQFRLESKIRLHSVKSFAPKSKNADESCMQVAEDSFFRKNNPKNDENMGEVVTDNKDLRKELAQIKEEKIILINKLFSLSSKLECLKKQSAKMAQEFNRNLNDVKEPKKQDQILMAIELQRKSSENSFLIDCISRLQEILSNSTLLKETSAVRLLQEKNRLNIDNLVATFEILVKKIVEKEADLSAKEYALETNQLAQQINKRELVLLRKKLEILETVSERVDAISRVTVDKENLKFVSLRQRNKQNPIEDGKHSVDRGDTAIFNNRSNAVNQTKPKFTPNEKESRFKKLRSQKQTPGKESVIDLEDIDVSAAIKKTSKVTQDEDAVKQLRKREPIRSGSKEEKIRSKSTRSQRWGKKRVKANQ